MGEIAYAVLTKPGGRRINEDSVMASEIPGGLAVAVADGLGAHGGGREASAAAVGQVWGCCGKGRLATTEEMRRMVSQADRAVRAVQTPESPGMSTLVFLVTERDRAVWAHVGDSRLYLVGKHGIRQITRDHSLVEEMIRLGGLSREDARRHPDKNIITRAIGAKDEVEAEFFTEELELGDIILMCSDGLSNMLEDKEIEKIVQNEELEELKQKAEALINAANNNGGKDNIAVVLVKIL